MFRGKKKEARFRTKSVYIANLYSYVGQKLTDQIQQVYSRRNETVKKNNYLNILLNLYLC